MYKLYLDDLLLLLRQLRDLKDQNSRRLQSLKFTYEPIDSLFVEEPSELPRPVPFLPFDAFADNILK